MAGSSSELDIPNNSIIHCVLFCFFFRGSFPTHGHRSVWFNMDMGTPFILLDILVYAFLAVEMVKQLGFSFARAASGEQKLNVRALVAIALLVYPNFFSFWVSIAMLSSFLQCYSSFSSFDFSLRQVLFNYINDGLWVENDGHCLFVDLTLLSRA